jgi:hypothetical protein
MREFFQYFLTESDRSSYSSVALKYAKHFIGSSQYMLQDKKTSHSRFNVGVYLSKADMGVPTKRVTLISDTLLLTHEPGGSHHHIETWRHVPNNGSVEMGGTGGGDYCSPSMEVLSGVYFHDINAVGRWILDSEPLLKAGLAWYLPNYTRASREYGLVQNSSKHFEFGGVDYIVRDRQVIDSSGATPIKSQVVRPVMRIDLPFIEGVSLRDFSNITVQEFDSYAGFRGWLRQQFLGLDAALDAVQSEHELVRIGEEIADSARSIHAEMERLKRTRAVGVTGAGIATVGAVLVAVYGPVLQAVIATLGLSGGAWKIIQEIHQNSTKPIREEKWYYVWVLDKESRKG